MARIKKIVVKIGTRLLTSKDNKLDEPHMDVLVSQLGDAVNSGIKVVLVSSGAIAAGVGLMGLKKRPMTMPGLQAAAAVGQSRLMQVYDSLFSKRNITVAQILLTAEDLNDRRRYINAKNTINELLDKNIVPIINENDTVSTEEIKFGDNDRLSSLVANLVEADKLIILTDVKGLYDGQGRLVCRVDEITDEVKRWARGATHDAAKGGMITKILAAEVAASSAISCYIADGRKSGILKELLYSDKPGEFTEFKGRSKKLKVKKSWIKFASKCEGKIIVDEGAKTALTQKNKSLLASGILACDGKFGAGCTVKIADNNNKEFAVGITNYSSDDINKIKGLKTGAMTGILGSKHYDEVIHKDNLVML